MTTTTLLGYPAWPTSPPVMDHNSKQAGSRPVRPSQDTSQNPSSPSMPTTAEENGVPSKPSSLYSGLSRAASTTTASSYYSKFDSVQASPIGIVSTPHPNADILPPLSLPKNSPSLGYQSPLVSAMPDTGTSIRGQGLIRRLSRGARNTISRKQSQKDLSKRRDQSSGPTVLRRRSDSRTAVDGSYDMSDLELDEADDTVPELDELESVSPSTTPSILPPPSIRSFSTDVPPSIPLELLEGTTMTKVTRKKRKPLLFTYDDAAAKIFWSNYRIAKQVYIDDIKEIRSGDKVMNLLEEYREPPESKDLLFTIIYSDVDRSRGRSTKSLHLKAPTAAICNIWLSALHGLQRYRESMMAGMAGNSELSRRAAWKREMAKRERGDREERVDFAQIKQFCRSFSIFKSDQDLRIQFARADVDSHGSLDYSQYMEFFRRLTERQDVRHVFEAAKSTNDVTMSREDFLNFLRSTQGVDLSSDPEGYWNNIYDRLTSRQKGQNLPLVSESVVPFAQGMSFETFQRFLLDEKLNSATLTAKFPPLLTEPLNDYFISSSHNTYLLGRQFGGESSSEGYVEALKKNCRCVEIDCWDGDDGRPRVTHGRSLTSKVSFLDCIKVINHYAFQGSKYPMIISLEVHCCPDQQRIMAENMKEVFGGQLILEPLNSDEVLPSPEMLKGRILVKVKEPRPEPPQMPLHRRQRSKSAPTPHIPAPPPYMISRRPTMAPPTSSRPVFERPPDAAAFNIAIREPRTSLASNPTSVSASSSDDSDIGTEASSVSSKKPKTSNIVKVLGEMGVYTRGIKFHDFRVPASRTYNHIFSFNETTFENKCKTPENKRLLEKHNTRYLMRVYPRPNRITSSNFNPLQFWRRGVQMAATNWQTYDLGSQINDAMFADGHDSSGYVLKPEELRRGKDDRTFDSMRKLRRKVIKFKVQIISAQHLTAPLDLKVDAEMNPYVELEVYSADDRAKNLAVGEGGIDASNRQGMSGIGSPHRRRTPAVKNNGYDPIWDETLSMKVDTKYPSLVFVRWTVWNSPDPSSGRLGREPFASYTAKLSSLQSGYRHIRLCNNKGEPTISTLFVRLQREELADAEPQGFGAPESVSDGPRSSEEIPRSGKDFLRRMFQRTPSQSQKTRKDPESGSVSRSMSYEK